MIQREKAELLLRLQQLGSSLLLPNAWDVASARLFEEAGFQAIGTTSAGIAYAHGYPDGEQMEREEMLQAITRIASLVQVPVTADMEAGYGEATVGGPLRLITSGLPELSSSSIGFVGQRCTNHVDMRTCVAVYSHLPGVKKPILAFCFQRPRGIPHCPVTVLLR